MHGKQCFLVRDESSMWHSPELRLTSALSVVSISGRVPSERGLGTDCFSIAVMKPRTTATYRRVCWSSQARGVWVHDGEMQAQRQEQEAKGSHLEPQAQSRENEPKPTWVFKLLKATSCDIFPPTRPHLSGLPNSSTIWEPSNQMPETMRGITFKPQFTSQGWIHHTEVLKPCINYKFQFPFF